MATGSKTIHWVLASGKSDGIIKVYTDNWIGSVYTFPRRELANVRDVLSNRWGVYILIGDQESKTEKVQAYIGKSGQLYKRLRDHNTNEARRWWSQTIVVVNDRNSFGETEFGYLESKLISLAEGSGFAEPETDIENKNKPRDEGHRNPSQVSAAEEFLEHFQLFVPLLGLTFLLPKAAEIEVASAKYELEYGKQPIAYAYKHEGFFYVRKGSKLVRKVTDEPRLGIAAKRKQHEDKIEDTDEEYLICTEDIPFSSPSGAASFVRGVSMNGRITWRNQATRKTIAEEDTEAAQQ